MQRDLRTTSRCKGWRSVPFSHPHPTSVSFRIHLKFWVAGRAFTPQRSRRGISDPNGRITPPLAAAVQPRAGRGRPSCRSNSYVQTQGTLTPIPRSSTGCSEGLTPQRQGAQHVFGVSDIAARKQTNVTKAIEFFAFKPSRLSLPRSDGRPLARASFWGRILVERWSALLGGAGDASPAGVRPAMAHFRDFMA